MINREKIILMTKLAVYDKRYGASDIKHSSFFRNEYVYWRNFWARFHALIGILIIVGLYALNKITVEKVDFFKIDYRQEGINILIFTAVILALVTFFSSVKATKEYSKIQRRIKQQLELMKKLDNMVDREKRENTTA